MALAWFEVASKGRLCMRLPTEALHLPHEEIGFRFGMCGLAVGAAGPSCTKGPHAAAARRRAARIPPVLAGRLRGPAAIPMGRADTVFIISGARGPTG